MPLDSSIASKLLRPSNKTKFHCSTRLVGNYFDILLVQFRDVRKCYVHNGTCVYVSCQVSLSMGFFRQEYCSGLPFSSPGDLLTQRLKLHLLTSVLNFFERYAPLSRKRQVSSKFPILHFQVFMDLVNTVCAPDQCFCNTFLEGKCFLSALIRQPLA